MPPRLSHAPSFISLLLHHHFPPPLTISTTFPLPYTQHPRYLRPPPHLFPPYPPRCFQEKTGILHARAAERLPWDHDGNTPSRFCQLDAGAAARRDYRCARRDSVHALPTTRFCMCNTYAGRAV